MRFEHLGANWMIHPPVLSQETGKFDVTVYVVADEYEFRERFDFEISDDQDGTENLPLDEEIVEILKKAVFLDLLARHTIARKSGVNFDAA